MRVVTINVEGVGKGWFDGRERAMVKGLGPLEPDVICFQETTVISHGDGYNQAEAIAQAVGLDYVAFTPYGNPLEVMSHAQGGLAIASRWPLRRVENRRLPSGHNQPEDNRVALIASIEAPGGDVHVATVHLAWQPEEEELRLMQLGLVLDYVDHKGWYADGARVILAGDLNMPDESKVVGLASRRLKDAYRACHPDDDGFTWIKDNPLTGDYALPDRRLDYVFCHEEAEVVRAEVVLDRPAPVYPSDHFGVFAEIRFRPPGRAG